MIDAPLVSIIIPIYNRVHFLEESLNSVAAQTYKNWECLLIDDGSNNETLQWITSYILSDDRFSLIERKVLPAGVSACRNIGAERAKGDFIIFLDSDDILAQTCLENRIRTIQENPNFNFWVFATKHFYDTPGDSSKFWNLLNKDNRSDLNRFIIHDNPWQTVGPIWKKTTIHTLKGFREGYSLWEDWEFHIQALSMNLKYYKSSNEETDSFYRRKPKGSKDSLSKEAETTENIKTKLSITKITFTDYAQHANKETKDSFATTIYRILEEKIADISIKDAISTIWFCYKHNIFTLFESALVLFMIRTRDVKISQKKVSNYFRKILKKHNPSKFDNQESKTYIYWQV